MRSAAEITNLWTIRRAALQKPHAAGLLIRQVYNGEYPLHLPELEKSEHSSIANLIQAGVDQHGTRIASVIPNIVCPPLKPTKQAIDRADDRRLTLQVWWHLNHIPRMLRRRARHLVGYASTPVMLRAGPDGYPLWEVRDPLATYPAPSAPEDLTPTDCIFSFRRTYAWLSATYPDIPVARRRDTTPDTLIDVLQYVDSDELVMVAIGQTDSHDPSPMSNGTAPAVELSRVPNRAGCPLVVIPGRVTLDRLQGQFDQLIGMYEGQATMWAYHMHAVRRAIFKETWLVGRPNEQPSIVQEADPYQGDIGVVEGGVLQDIAPEPGVQTIQALNILERNQRLTGAIPAEMGGGESPTNVRTDRRGQSVLSGAIDFPIQEHQELLAASLEAENKCAIAISKAYWGNTPKTFVVPFGRGQVTYTPNATFDTDMHRVSYAYAGTDTNSLVIESGQRVGMGTLSKKSFMMIDPMVTDPDAEHDRVVVEAIEAAFLQSIQTQAADPNGPWTPVQLARLTQLVYEKNMTLYEAVQKIHAEAQAEQAAQVDPNSPTAQPGLGQAGAPGTPQAAIPPPNASQQDLMSLLQSLRKPAAGPFGAPQEIPAR